MAYPQHWLLAFGGHQGDTAEQWVCGIRMAVQGLDPFDEMDEEQYLDNTAVPALTAWFLRAGSNIASVTRINWIKFNEIGPEGLYVDQSQTHERQGLSISSGGGSTNLHPLQVACVLSWRTNEAERGLASRGRIYSPRPAVAIDATGDVIGPARVAIADSAALLLNSLDASLGVAPAAVVRPHIVSRGKKTGSTWGPGAAHQIDRVVVDSSLDIQRRRSYSQSKEVTSAVVAY